MNPPSDPPRPRYVVPPPGGFSVVPSDPPRNPPGPGAGPRSPDDRVLLMGRRGACTHRMAVALLSLAANPPSYAGFE